jgi:SAM-dependent methyltransferase
MMDDLRAYFEDLARDWDSLQPTDRGIVLERLLARFASILSASSDILEVGTGTGALIPCLRATSPDARLVSIDLAGEMLRRARERCPDATVVQSDVHLAPFASQQFDLAVCHNSFPHFADKPGSLLSIARVLRPGGYLLILHDLGRERVNAIHSNGGRAIQRDLLPPGEETKRMMVRAGFVDEWAEDTGDHYLVSGRVRRYPRARLLPPTLAAAKSVLTRLFPGHRIRYCRRRKERRDACH